MTDYDAILVVSFGGPEKPEDVMPFLENVTRGRNVPRERLIEVSHHYDHFGGKSPINEQVRSFNAALEQALAERGPKLPLYWGNRNWHPLLPATVAQMKADGVRRALTYVTSAFSSYSGCRQYRENLEAARAEVGEGAPELDKLRVFYDHPGFIETMAARTSQALESLGDAARGARLVFTAHSIPIGMARGCKYEVQLRESARLVCERLGRTEYDVVYQSRSGPPSVPWLEPDILDHLRILKATGTEAVCLVPIGFLSDHVEIAWDLDEEAKSLCAELGIRYARAKTAGDHPLFVEMVRELIVERIEQRPKRALGVIAEPYDVCPVDCCLSGARPRP